jgi:hypothetical protein
MSDLCPFRRRTPWLTANPSAIFTGVHCTRSAFRPKVALNAPILPAARLPDHSRIWRANGTTSGTKADILDIQFRRMEAEAWLNDEKAR